MTNCLQDNILFEIDRIAARMSEQVPQRVSSMCSCYCDSFVRKQYCEICRSSCDGCSSFMELRPRLKSNSCSPNLSSQSLCSST
jgi:hypothetical protein